ncbi:UNVERIFIED_CONTAM: hypothetical protein Sangu_2597700, partial [Sesamum angustifolium]
LQHSKATTTPLRVGIKVAADAGSVLPNPEQYRRLVERLLYFGFSRPDISHASQQLSQFMQVPCQQHWDVALHVLKYLKGTTNKGLFFPSRKPLELKAYGNVDWADCLDTMRSLTRYCVFLGYHGRQKNRIQFQGRRQRQNIEAWLPQLASYFGYIIFFKI